MQINSPRGKNNLARRPTNSVEISLIDWAAWKVGIVFAGAGLEVGTLFWLLALSCWTALCRLFPRQPAWDAVALAHHAANEVERVFTADPGFGADAGAIDRNVVGAARLYIGARFCRDFDVRHLVRLCGLEHS